MKKRLLLLKASHDLNVAKQQCRFRVADEIDGIAKLHARIAIATMQEASLNIRKAMKCKG